MARGLLGFTALMLAAFVVLIGLGLWQLQRLEWKEGLIAKIEARTKAAADRSRRRGRNGRAR